MFSCQTENSLSFHLTFWSKNGLSTTYRKKLVPFKVLKFDFLGRLLQGRFLWFSFFSSECRSRYQAIAYRCLVPKLPHHRPVGLSRGPGRGKMSLCSTMSHQNVALDTSFLVIEIPLFSVPVSLPLNVNELVLSAGCFLK